MDRIECPFCDPPETDIVLKNDQCYARWDGYPVSNGHLLIVPFRHFASYFEATKDEMGAIWKLVSLARALVEERYGPDGLNIGINIGAAAGQTVPHLHVHLIPRYEGDMEDPRGGVRGVIPARRKY